MLIKKGTKLIVKVERKGTYQAVVEHDFDTEKTKWFPLILDQDIPVKGLQGRPKWFRGDRMPARNTLTTLTIT